MSNVQAAPKSREAIASIPVSELNPSESESFVDNSCLEIFKRMRGIADSLDSKSNVGSFWSLTRYDDISAVDRNHEVFSSDISRGGVGITDMSKNLPMPMFLASDPPKHTEQRRTVSPIFSPAQLKRLEVIIRERAAKLLDAVPVNEPFDWVDKISIELTTQMLTTLFDFPWDDRRKLTRWSDVAASTPGNGIIDSEEQRNSEMMECLEYFANLWNERAKAEPRPDLISMLAQGALTKDMPPMEFLGNIVLLMVGGNDTTRNSITGGLYALNLFPDQFKKVREDRNLIPNMVSEIIRWQTPIAYQRRTAVRDTEVRGTRIKEGERVVMWYVSGNRDESFFKRADELIIDRADARRHIAFGVGIHRCFGFRFAEMQLRIVWEEILKRWDFIEVLAEPTRIHSSVIRGYNYMPVRIRG